MAAPNPPSHHGRVGVLLDVDGTLVDSNYLHTLAWAQALAEVGEWAPMNAIHRLVGMGGDHLVPELLGRDIPKAAEARSRIYQELIGEVHAFPGAADLITHLHEAGVAVVLASSAPADELDTMIELLGVGGLIDATTNGDDAENSKPDPDIFGAALEAGDIDRRRCLVVGDSVWDVHAAHAAGLGCVAVESGGSSRHELTEAGALCVYRDVRDLDDQLLIGPLRALIDEARMEAHHG